MTNATYVSGDEVNRSAARAYGIADIHVHPRALAPVIGGAVVLFDLDHPLFADAAGARLAAERAAIAGAVVGLHSYFPDDPALAGLRKHDNVVVARNLAQLWPALRKLRNAPAANTGSAQEVRHDHHDSAADADRTREIAFDATRTDFRPVGGAGRASQRTAS
ncbi:MAG: hypothetical protein KF873_03080 [Gemmataceae bacterium]|nr:hypothetical protein [Gemmataceae bacterium]